MSRVKMDRVCIVMMSAIGDAVHVLPVLTALKRHHPTMHVTWVLQPGPATLVRDHPDLDEIILFDRSRGWRGFAEIRRTLQSRPFDLVINLQVSFKAGLVTSFTCAPMKLGFDRARARDLNWLFTTHRIPAGPRRHVQEQYFEFLKWLEVPHEPVTLGTGSLERGRAGVATRLSCAIRAPDRADCSRDKQAAEGLASGAVGRGERRPLSRVRPTAGSGGRALTTRSAR